MSCIGLTVTRATLRRGVAHSPICARDFVFVLRRTCRSRLRQPRRLSRCRAADERDAFGQRRALLDEDRVQREKELPIAGMSKRVARSSLLNRIKRLLLQLRQYIVIPWHHHGKVRTRLFDALSFEMFEKALFSFKYE